MEKKDLYNSQEELMKLAINCLGKLKKLLISNEKLNSLHINELRAIIEILNDFSYLEKVQILGLRQDRADVILIGAIAILMVMEEFGVKSLKIPNVGLKEGLLLKLAYTDVPLAVAV